MWAIVFLILALLVIAIIICAILGVPFLTGLGFEYAFSLIQDTDVSLTHALALGLLICGALMGVFVVRKIIKYFDWMGR